MHRRSTVYKQKQSKSSLNKYIDVRGQQRMEEWELKWLNNGLFLTKHTFFASQDINYWTGVVWIIVMFYQLFGLSF